MAVKKKYSSFEVSINSQLYCRNRFKVISLDFFSACYRLPFITFRIENQSIRVLMLCFLSIL